MPMQTLLSSKASTNKIQPFRNRSMVHSHQEKRTGTITQSAVEFKDNLIPQNTPKLIFGHGQGVNVSPMNQSHVPMTPQHEDNIRFATEEWERVRSDLNNSDPQQRKGCVPYIERHEYKDHDFKPFDLENLWGERVLKEALESDKQ